MSEPPPWLVEGADVVHPTHGTGTVARVGEERRLPTVWVDFDYGERRALAMRYAVDLLRRPQAGSQRTRPKPAVRCDQCGRRPVVLRAEGHQWCEEHVPQEV
ncbi:hypothetical protein [Nocardioides marmoribigeumensis]|jgi:hypothetical protein|uniref:CarD-like/TRCF RNAP-interacting domain-containing protein n=1 Tax=Nocardioides marmoribigeumensis TaxID=433649 RepID=A0ABU2BWJ2_9ACTN|nr:hypothetical protein [Nocardioides marmoribigeumensis]MDR7362766.1 hypothetical protein [Nocardioides marmoribigeumensis]